MTLFSRILFWFLLSLGLLLLLAVGVFNLQFRLSPFSPLRAVSAEALDSVARLIERDLRAEDRAAWDDVLRRCSDTYAVEFMLVSETGSHLAGARIALPPVVMEGAPRFRGGPPSGEPGPAQREGGGPPRRVVLRTEDPVRYWGVVPLMLHDPGGGPPTHPLLVAVSDRRDGHGLFFDARPWLLAGAALLALLVLVLVPLVRSLTTPIAIMTSATEEISRGRFDVRLDTRRSDEIGRLGRAINDMAARLGRLVRGQKRFLADVAHELSSPIARLEVALEILKQDASRSVQTVEDIGEDVRHMAELVQELLLYVRAEQDPQRTTLGPVALRAVVDQAVRRECGDSPAVSVEVDDGAVAMANPALLTRALANLLRNAARYAPGAHVTIRAQRRGHSVVIEVRDDGPGVPERALSQLFEPFYRPDDSRAAETGGVGLGLAIVRTCIEACRGRVSARNVEPHGLSVTVELGAVPEEEGTA